MFDQTNDQMSRVYDRYERLQELLTVKCIISVLLPPSQRDEARKKLEALDRYLYIRRHRELMALATKVVSDGLTAEMKEAGRHGN